MALASIIYDFLDDYIVHASIHKFLSSERAAALEHLKVLEDMGIFPLKLLPGTVYVPALALPDIRLMP